MIFFVAVITSNDRPHPKTCYWSYVRTKISSWSDVMTCVEQDWSDKLPIIRKSLLLLLSTNLFVIILHNPNVGEGYSRQSTCFGESYIRVCVGKSRTTLAAGRFLCDRDMLLSIVLDLQRLLSSFPHQNSVSLSLSLSLRWPRRGEWRTNSRRV